MDHIQQRSQNTSNESFLSFTNKHKSKIKTTKKTNSVTTMATMKKRTALRHTTEWRVSYVKHEAGENGEIELTLVEYDNNGNQGETYVITDVHYKAKAYSNTFLAVVSF